jgi:hypothetical protein
MAGCLAHGVWRWLVRVPAQGTTATWTDLRWERRHPRRSWALGQRRPGQDLAQGVAVAWCLTAWSGLGAGNDSAWTGSRGGTCERRRLGRGRAQGVAAT